MKEQRELPGEFSHCEGEGDHPHQSKGEITHRGVIWRYNETWGGWFTIGRSNGTAWSIHVLKDEIEEKTNRLLDKDRFTPAIGWRA